MDVLAEAGITPQQIEAFKAAQQPTSQNQDVLADAGITPQQIEAFKRQTSASSPLATAIASKYPSLAKGIIDVGDVSKSIYNHLMNIPLVGSAINAGVAAGQEDSQIMDNALNLAARHHVLSRMINAATLGIKTPPGTLVSKLETAMTKRPLEAPQAAEPGISATIGKVAGQIPLFAAGGALGEAGAGVLGETAANIPRIEKLAEAAKSMPMLSKISSGIPGLLGRAVGTAGASTLVAPSAPGTAAVTGGLSSVALDALSPMLGGLGQVGKAIAGKALKMSPGTQKVLRAFFTGEAKPHLQGTVNSIMDELKGTSSPESAGQDLYNSIESRYHSLMGTPGHDAPPEGSVAEAYNAVSDSAPFDQTSYNNVTNENINKINKSVAHLSDTSMVKKPYLDAVNVLKDLKSADLSTIGAAKMHKELINTLLADPTTSNILRPALQDIKGRGIFNSMSSGEAGMNSGDLEALKHADQRYKNEIVPFKKANPDALKSPESPFWKALRTGAKQNEIWNQYLKPGAARDQYDLINKFMKIAPKDEDRKLLLYNYLKDTEGSPHLMMKKWAKLGSNQKQLLLPEHRELLDEYAKLNHIEPKAFMPEEGKHTLANLVHYGVPGVGVAHAISGSPIAGSAEAIAGWMAPAIKRAIGRRLFRNPKNLDLFVKELKDTGILKDESVAPTKNYLRNMLLASGATFLGH